MMRARAVAGAAKAALQILMSRRPENPPVPSSHPVDRNAAPRAGRPLDGVLVVALEQAVAAPYATARLADAGARVIKLERPEGDFARGYDRVAAGQSSYFVWLNRGKESVLADLSQDEDRRLFEALIAKADVLVQNLKPGALAKLGYPIEALREKYPRLIACSICGYGEAGALAERKAYDLLIQAESGLASITGGPAEPARVGVSIVDIATGAEAARAILEALYARERGGEGADIRISMFDVIVDWMTVPFLHAAAGAPPRRVGLAHPSIAPYGVFTTRDDKKLLISIQNEREWARLCREALDDPHFADDPRFHVNVKRVENRAETDERTQASFARFDASEMTARLDKAGIAFASVNDVTDLLTHPALSTLVTATPQGPVTTPAPGARFVGAPRDYGPAPALGAQDTAVRAEFMKD
jgi:crotonobetainyl-CoA:carnitine CoA-transferase CaiB-like acyl-CoA transferase